MQLLLRFGNAQARLHNLVPRIMIGGDPGTCQLVFQDGSVGRMHAEVYLENGTPFIRDLGSGCGTWIDGAQVTTMPAMLRPGVNVMLGRVPLVIQQEGDTYQQAAYGQPMQPGYAPPNPQPGYGPPQQMMPPQAGYAPPMPQPGYGPPMQQAPQPMPGYGAPMGQPPGYAQPMGQPMPQPMMPQAGYAPPMQAMPQPMMPQPMMQQPMMQQPMMPQPGYPPAGYAPPPQPGYGPPPQQAYVQQPYPQPQAQPQSQPQPQPIAGSPAELEARARAAAPGKNQGAANEMLGVGGAAAPKPNECSYRRQASNNNGVLLIALRGDTFQNAMTIDGFVEFTSTDNETISSIFVELIEHHKDGPKAHVWDKMLVRQGPWKSQKNETVPMPFSLRVPPGTSPSGPICNWEIKGYVDVSWGFDLECNCPISMRNIDLERVRDALGALDYRIVQLDPLPLGQHFKGKFQPPAQLKSQLGISDINLNVEYLGTNMKMTLEVEKTSLFKFDKHHDIVFELAKLRTAPLEQISQYFQQEINVMMGK